VTFSCDSTTYTVSSISYSVGVLEVTADYTTDMEGLPCILSITFDSSLILSPAVALHFSAVSNTVPLRISLFKGEFAIIEMVFEYVAYAALAVFLLALPHKMMGAELLSSCVLAYLSNALYQESSFLLSSIKKFNLVTGDWALLHTEDDAGLIRPFTDRVELTEYFLTSSAITFTVLAAIVLLMVLLNALRALAFKGEKQARKGGDA
jgi:hypothetical protein